MWRDRLCQWLTALYPTRRIQRARWARAGYALLLRALRPRGPIHLRTPHYRLWFTPGEADLAHRIALGGPWEPLETAALRAALRPGDGVLDVGANVGHYALIAAHAVGPRGHVWAFEPTPRPFAALAANVRLNGLRNVTQVQAACGERDGTATLHLDAANAGGHSLAADNVEQPGGAVPVAALRLDTWLEARLARNQPTPPVRLLKSDAQGAELAVLRGAEGLLRTLRPTLLLEFWPYGLRRCGGDADALLRLLVAHGYALEVLHEPSGARYPATPERLPVDFPAHVAWAFTTLLATPLSR